MKQNGMLLSLILFSLFSIAQDERDVFVGKLIKPETTLEGAQGLYDSYQLGGVRTIIKQFNNMPADLALQYAFAFRNLDLFRFRNDMNANLLEAKSPEHRGVALMLLSSLGRQIDANTFMKFAENPTEDIRVRLAAATCLCAVQNPRYFELYAQIAEEAVVDYETGRNDFVYCDFTFVSPGLFYYLKPKLEERSTSTHGVKIVMLQTVNPNSTEFYEMLLEAREKDYFPMMVNQAIKVGSVDLLKMMADHKRAKKIKDKVQAAIPAAALVAKYKPKTFKHAKKEQYPIGALFSRPMQGKGVEGYLKGSAALKVDANGTISVLEESSPFGGSGVFSSYSGKTTMAAKLDFQPVESIYLVVAPF